jgi:O-glycosyl hydrolase
MKFRICMALLSMTCLPISSAIAATASPVAFVYVASNYSGNNNQISGYSVASNGQLTKINGSPFYANVSSMAVIGTCTSSVKEPNITVSKIAANRARTPVRIAIPAARKQTPVACPQNTCEGGSHLGISGAVRFMKTKCAPPNTSAQAPNVIRPHD